MTFSLERCDFLVDRFFSASFWILFHFTTVPHAVQGLALQTLYVLTPTKFERANYSHIFLNFKHQNWGNERQH
jgi:hypothetical protein